MNEIDAQSSPQRRAGNYIFLSIIALLWHWKSLGYRYVLDDSVQWLDSSGTLVEERDIQSRLAAREKLSVS